MLRLVTLLVLVVSTSARKSANHEYIEELIRETPVGDKALHDILKLALLDVEIDQHLKLSPLTLNYIISSDLLTTKLRAATLSAITQPDVIKAYGYPSEAHQIITEDGYILEAHRIPYGKDGPSPNRPVAFLMHGMLSSSADFVTLGPEKNLGYLLADQGYDVWLGNARGNYYSRNHVTLNPDSDLNFWKFSWDEIGNFDLPALIDYALKITGQNKLHYIGHSQGGTSFYVLTSLRPEYNEKIITFQGYAPSAYFSHNEDPISNLLSPYENVIEKLAFRLGIPEMLPRKCHAPTSGLGSYIEFIICLYGKLVRKTDNKADEILVSAHTPAGASIRQIRHYGQCIKYDTFRRLYHDPITNLFLYGSLTPPDYDVTKITTRAYLHYGLGDTTVNYRDVQKLAEDLPNAVLQEVSEPTFGHRDFLFHPNVTELVYKKTLKIMESYN